nr:ATPase, T2SS/T4P/T4SS family [bacterium]
MKLNETSVLEIQKLKIEPDVLTKISYSFALKYTVIPFDFDESKNVLKIAMADAANVEILDELKLLTGCAIKAHYCEPQNIIECINKFYLNETKPAEEIESLNSNYSTIDIADEIIRQSIKERASDIHIEAYENSVKLRYRIDGILYDIKSYPKSLLNALISRIKIMANLNIAEKRLPQDGKIIFNISGKHIDMRVSVLPTNYGESVVI